jgi:hypothetical protein
MFDPDDPSVLWLRPVLGGARSPEPGGSYVFNLSLSRGRDLAYSSARIDESGDLVLIRHARELVTFAGSGMAAGDVTPASGGRFADAGSAIPWIGVWRIGLEHGNLPMNDTECTDNHHW